MYDCIIIGSGPSGISAAINLKTHNKNFIMFGSDKLSDKVLKAERIVNYPGIPSMSGNEFYERLKEHLFSQEISIENKSVTAVMESGTGYMVLADNEIYEGKTIILAMGVMNAKTLENEDRLLGHGVSYCATCDGMLYKGKDIAVICNDDKYEHEVSYLSEIARKVYYIKTFKETNIKADNVEVIEDNVIEILGENEVSGIKLKSGNNIDVAGVFCLRNAIAPSSLIPGIEVEDGHIKVNRMMETNLKGLFAAGDVTGRPYQYTKAVGEGNVAAHSVISYLG